MSPAILSSEFSTPSSACSHRSRPHGSDASTGGEGHLDQNGSHRHAAHTKTASALNTLTDWSRVQDQNDQNRSFGPSSVRCDSYSTDRHPHVWELESVQTSEEACTKNDSFTLISAGPGDNGSDFHFDTHVADDNDDDHDCDQNERDDGDHHIPLILDLEKRRSDPHHMSVCDCPQRALASPLLLEDITPDKYVGDEIVGDHLLNVSELLNRLTYRPSFSVQSSHDSDADGDGDGDSDGVRRSTLGLKEDETDFHYRSRRCRPPQSVRPLPPIPMPAQIPMLSSRSLEVSCSPPSALPSRRDSTCPDEGSDRNQPRPKPAGPRDARLPSSSTSRFRSQVEVGPAGAKAREARVSAQRSRARSRAAFYISDSPGQPSHRVNGQQPEDDDTSAMGISPPSPMITHLPRPLPPDVAYYGSLRRTNHHDDQTYSNSGFRHDYGRAPKTFRVVNTSPPPPSSLSASDTDPLTPPGSELNSASISRSDSLPDPYSDSGTSFSSRAHSQVSYDDGINDYREQDDEGSIYLVSEDSASRVRVSALHDDGIDIADGGRRGQDCHTRWQIPTHGTAHAYVDASVKAVDAALPDADTAAPLDSKSKKSFFRRSQLPSSQAPAVRFPKNQSPSVASRNASRSHNAADREQERRRAGSEDWTQWRTREV
ncbi:hypothetical protein I317_02826 [Kwoniella heveanensis CBS 569]|nr:hypothetical protein I317_02826 [Kwoniella heveanensis CBS 569]